MVSEKEETTCHDEESMQNIGKKWGFLAVFSVTFQKDTYCISLFLSLQGRRCYMWLWSNTDWRVVVNVILSNSVCLYSPLEQQSNK